MNRPRGCYRARLQRISFDTAGRPPSRPPPRQLLMPSLPRTRSSFGAPRATASPRLSTGPAARTGLHPPRYRFRTAGRCCYARGIRSRRARRCDDRSDVRLLGELTAASAAEHAFGRRSDRANARHRVEQSNGPRSAGPDGRDCVEEGVESRLAHTAATSLRARTSSSGTTRAASRAAAPATGRRAVPNPVFRRRRR